MEENKVEKNKVEEKKIFPEATVDGITVKPWKFGVLFQISHFLADILDKMEAKNINFGMDEMGFVPYITIAKIFTIASDSILKIVAITLGMSEEEISNFDIEKGMEITTIIYMQNSKVIKDSISKIFVKKTE